LTPRIKDGSFSGNSVTVKAVTAMALTGTTCKNAKATPDKACKLTDEKGLYLLISKKGGKWWRFR